MKHVIRRNTQNEKRAKTLCTSAKERAVARCGQQGSAQVFGVKQPILLLAALACCLVLLFAVAFPAWADEEESATQSVDTNGNIVNVNQMPDSSFLYNTDIADLAGAESFHDTQTVQVTGEVVGDHINDELDSNLCWITLQSTKADDYSLVSVLMTNEQAKLIENYGNYNTDGTIFQVRGTFYLSCSEHQGLSDIHAKEVTVVKQGSPRKHPVNDAVLWTSCLAVGLGVLSLFTYSFLRERRK